MFLVHLIFFYSSHFHTVVVMLYPKLFPLLLHDQFNGLHPASMLSDQSLLCASLVTKGLCFLYEYSED